MSRESLELEALMSAQNKLHRHPRSFPPSGELWRVLKAGADRRAKVGGGQRLYDVDERLKTPEIEKEPSVRRRLSLDLRKGPAASALRRGKRFSRHSAADLLPGKGGRKLGSVSASALSRAASATSFPADFDDSFSKLPDTRLHFGSGVALQSLQTDGFLVVRNSSDGKLDGKLESVQPDELDRRDVSHFKIVDMADLASCKAVQFGDFVYLQIVAGAGEPSWRNGSVVGARVHEVEGLPTVPLDASQSEYLADADEAAQRSSPAPLGRPAPVRATLPSGKVDRLLGPHELKTRNEAALALGRWRLMPATRALQQRAQRRGGYVCNLDEAYLEQDFYYVGAEDDGRAALHRLPHGVGGGDGAYRVERRGVWRIRVAEASADLRDMSKDEQRAELLMERARKSMQRSDDYRHGKRRYGPDGATAAQPDADEPFIAGGASFAQDLRDSTKRAANLHEVASLAEHVRKEGAPHAYFRQKFATVGPPIYARSRLKDDATTAAAKATLEALQRRALRRSHSDAASTITFEDQARGQEALSSLCSSSLATLDPLEAVAHASVAYSAQHTSTVAAPVRFSTPKKARRPRPSPASSRDAAPPGRDATWDESMTAQQKKKSQLLGAAVSWPYALCDEDVQVWGQLKDPEISQRAALMALAAAAPRGDGASYVSLASPSSHASFASEPPTFSLLRNGSVSSLAVSQADEESHAPLGSLGDDDADDAAASVLALRTVDGWAAKWLGKLAAQGVDRLERTLCGEDDFLVRNIAFSNRRAAFKDKFPTPKKPPLPSNKSGSLSDVASIAMSAFMTDVPSEGVYEKAASLRCFQGDGAVLAEMLASTLTLLRDTIVPSLKAHGVANADGAVGNLVELSCEAAFFTLTFTERLVAPALRRAATRCRDVVRAALARDVPEDDHDFLQDLDADDVAEAAEAVDAPELRDALSALVAAMETFGAAGAEALRHARASAESRPSSSKPRASNNSRPGSSKHAGSRPPSGSRPSSKGSGRTSP